MKNSTLIKIAATLIVISITIIILSLTNNKKPPENREGKIKIVLRTGSSEDTQEHFFNANETLYTLLIREYNVEIKPDVEYIMITKLNFLETSSNTYIAFYINDNYAVTGVTETYLEADAVYLFVLTVW